MGEEGELGEDDAEPGGDEQLEPAVAQRDEPDAEADERRGDAGEHEHVESDAALQQPGFADGVEQTRVGGGGIRSTAALGLGQHDAGRGGGVGVCHVPAHSNVGASRPGGAARLTGPRGCSAVIRVTLRLPGIRGDRVLTLPCREAPWAEKPSVRRGSSVACNVRGRPPRGSVPDRWRSSTDAFPPRHGRRRRPGSGDASAGYGTITARPRTVPAASAAYASGPSSSAYRCVSTVTCPERARSSTSISSERLPQ